MRTVHPATTGVDRRHAVAARDDRVPARQRAAGRRRSHRSSARSHRRRRSTRSTRASAPTSRCSSSTSSRSSGSSRSTSATRTRRGSGVIDMHPPGARPLGQAGAAGVHHHDPDLDRRRHVRRSPAGQVRRPGDRQRRPRLVVDPRVRHRSAAAVGVRRALEARQGVRQPARGHEPDRPARVPAAAGARDGDRLLRVHRPHDPSRRHLRPPGRLHPNSHHEGPVEQAGDAPSRAAQRARPDDHGHLRPDRLPVRRHHRRREGLQLPRPRLARC